MTNEKYFDPRGIDVCIDSLFKLKKQGGQCGPDGLWNSEILHRYVQLPGRPIVIVRYLKTADRLNHLEHWSKDLPLISEAESTLRLLGGAQNILECFLETLQATISDVASALGPFQCGKGLDSLPDDVLSMILVYAGSRTEQSLVCRRFRRVASSIPQLWCSISNTMKSMHHVHRSLKESKAVTLDIELHLVTREPQDFSLDSTQVLDAALVHVNRWENLRFTSRPNPSWENTKDSIGKLDERLKNIHLPKLRSLSIAFPDEFEDDESDVDPVDDPNSVVHFYRSWSLPKLHDLHIERFIPVSFVTPALSSLTLSLPMKDGDGFSVLRIIEFLSSIPHLEDLRLSVGDLIVAPDLPSLILPHLKSLRLDVMHWMILQVAPFTKVLFTPTIHSMHLSVERHGDGDPELLEWLEAFLCHDEYPSLKELTFDFLDYFGNSSTYTIPFKRLPNLESITLDTSQWHPRTDYAFLEKDEPVPPLRSMRLLGNVDSRWRHWLDGVKTRMQDQGKLANFESLTISGPEVLDADDVEDMFAGKRVVWEDSPDDRYTAFYS